MIKIPRLGYKIMLGLGYILITGCAYHESTKITRYTLNSWEPEIGYAAVVQAGNSFHISGVVCDGPDYQKAVGECYQELQTILDKLKLTPKNIVKENVYTLDIEQFKLQIEQRKKFYGNADYPAATWVQINRLFNSRQVVEVELIAVR